MLFTSLAIVDLLFLLVAAAFGLASFLAWARHRAAGFPTAKIIAHVALQIAGIGLWVAFAATGAVPLAWIAFAMLTAGQVLGDLLMFASHRARHPGAERQSYLRIGGEVLSFKRPRAALHAWFGAVAWFGMLAICVAVSLTA